MTETKMACKEFVELVTEYLEGTLAPGDRARFDHHLGYCTPCVGYLDQFRETIRLTGTLTEDDLDPAARELLLEEFKNFKRST
jgi:predicted anti-sigma-YlaC factor YlaD